MAMACATTPATISVVGSSSVGSTRSGKRNVHFIKGLNLFGGLKAQNSVTSLGLPVCTEKCFAKVVSSLKHPSSKGRGGGAASSTCNAAGEIFQIAAIMNGLVLVGVAVGFVLLRVEASVEEADFI
ncbi:Cytochrome b6-f complex subunit 7, partial [Mucuna pruriens]